MLKYLPLFWVLMIGADSAWAGKCATGRDHGDPGRTFATRPMLRSRAVSTSRVPAPVPTAANVHTSEHFRVLWGDEYDRDDTDWQLDDGVPLWVRALSHALEHAYEVQTGLGFPEPYGVASYYLDAYVGNTGVVADATEITIGSSYYAYTEIDRDPGLLAPVAYFVFNDDFSAYVDDELSVLWATAAHELFHAVQRAMGYPWDAEGPWAGDDYIDDTRWQEEGWWVEASATWIEEITVPDVDDYVNYVQDFLAAPGEALNSMDGLHEYGAAVFAGYLWRQHGGAEFLESVFEDAYVTANGPETVESAMREGLLARDGADLEDVIATFWVFAADPDPAIWPDAEQFHTGVAPALLSAPEVTPVTVWPGSSERPERFAANLLRVPAGDLPTWFGMEGLDPTARWRVAVRTPGDRDAEVFEPNTADPEWLGIASEGHAYVAVVNVSTDDGPEHYAIQIGGDGLIDGNVPWREAHTGGTVSAGPVTPATPSNSKGGGCFLGLLLH